MKLEKFTMTLFCLFLFIGFSVAFMPGVLRQFADWSSLTHRIITRAGLWSTVIEFLKDNPEYVKDGQIPSNLIPSVIQPQLLQGQIPHELLGLVRSSRFTDTVQEIEDSNVQVDNNEAEFSASHFDAEQFRKSSLRLLLLKKRVIALILNADNDEVKYETARQEAGRYLHTLQDFYSHSNWIEFGNVAPLEILGDELIAADHVAAAEEKTCQSCTPITSSQTSDNCQDNLIFDLRKLTSGYVGGQDVEKPANGGKCSHGGLFDSSRNQEATGGINKDTNRRDLSPHYRHHVTAASVAIKATKLFFDDIRGNVSKEKFARFLHLTPMRVISFVIDVTASMAVEISGVRKVTKRFVEDAAAVGKDFHFVLVPFGDPNFGPNYVTSSASEAMSHVNALNAQGGGDCPEMAMSGLYLALFHSLPHADIYFFTDAAAKDIYLASAVRSLALRKKCRLYLFTSGSCSVAKRRKRRSVSERELCELFAGSTGGQCITFHKFHITEVFKLIGNPNIAEDNSSLIYHKATLMSVQVTNETTTTDKTYVVKCDSSVLTMTAVLSSEGNANIQVVLPSGADNQDITVVTQISTVHGIRIVKPSAGSWIFKITASGRYSFQVTAQSTLKFSTTLEQSHDSARYGKIFVPLSGDPIIGKKLYLTVTPSPLDVMQMNRPITGYLTDTAGNKLQSFDLERGEQTHNNSYYGSVEMQYDTFMIMYEGHAKNGEIIKRQHSGVIVAQDVQLILVMTGNSTDLVLSPNEERSIDVTLRNSGSTKNFSIFVSEEHSFVKSYSPSQVSLTTGQSIDITLVLLAPASIKNSTTDWISVSVSTPAYLLGISLSFEVSVFSKEFLVINEDEATTKEDISSFLIPPSQDDGEDNGDDDGLSTSSIVLIAVLASVFVIIAIVITVVLVIVLNKSGSAKGPHVSENPAIHEVYHGNKY